MRLLRHRCDIKRFESVGGRAKALSTFAENIRCLAMPMSDIRAVQNQFDVSKGFVVYFDITSDVKAGDELYIRDLDIYLNVSGVKKYANMPPVSHIEAAASLRQ